MEKTNMLYFFLNISLKKDEEKYIQREENIKYLIYKYIIINNPFKI